MTLKERLRLFNAKVDTLAGLSFHQHVTTRKTKTNIRWKRDTGFESGFDSPNDESIDAAVLTIRQFMQDNDPMSLRHVSVELASSSVSQPLRDEFELVRSGLNEMLDSPTNISIKEGSRLRYRDVVEIFIYGGLAHSTQPYQKTYEDLQGTVFFPMIQADFVLAIGLFMVALRQMSRVNSQVLADLDASGGA